MLSLFVSSGIDNFAAIILIYPFAWTIPFASIGYDNNNSQGAIVGVVVGGFAALSTAMFLLPFLLVLTL